MKKTSHSRPRRRRTGIARIPAMLLALCCSVHAHDSRSADWQPLEGVVSAAETALERAFSEADGRNLEIVVNPPDPRLRLPRCDTELAVDVPGRSRESARPVVQVRCPGSQRWQLYVSARVSLERPVLVASRALARGQVLTEADVEVQHRRIRRMGERHLTDARSVLGQELRRSIDAGEALRTSYVRPHEVISRGDRVTIRAGSGAIVVSTEGKALRDGAVGSRIGVENLASGKRIEGEVTGPGEVRVR